MQELWPYRALESLTWQKFSSVDTLYQVFTPEIKRGFVRLLTLVFYCIAEDSSQSNSLRSTPQSPLKSILRAQLPNQQRTIVQVCLTAPNSSYTRNLTLWSDKVCDK